MGQAEAASPGFTAPEFQKVLRGWDPEEVREHLDMVHSRVRALEERIRTLDAELEEARRERDGAKAAMTDPYAGVSGHVASVRATADAEAARTRSEVLALRSSMLDDLRAIRRHMASSLKELDAALEVDVAPVPNDVAALPEVGDRAPAVAALPRVGDQAPVVAAPTEHTATGPAAAM